MTWQEERELYNLNNSIIPNGGIFYEEITKHIYKNKFHGLTEEFMNEISRLIYDLNYHIMSGNIRVNDKYLVLPANWFEIHDDYLYIEVKFNLKNPFMEYEGDIFSIEKQFIRVPIHLERSLDAIRFEGVKENMVNDYTNKINKQLINEYLRAKKDRFSSKWRDNYKQRARKFNGTNSQKQRTCSSCSC